MSLEDKAKKVMEQLWKISDEARMVGDHISMAFNKMTFDSQTIEFSAADKQKLITWYQKRKAVLEQLVNDLP